MFIANNEFAEQVDKGLDRLKKIQAYLKEILVGKDDIIEMMMVCSIAQEPMLIFGEPGTAKSIMISTFCNLLGMKEDYFEYLLTSFTEPDELLGAIDIQAYTQEGKYKRVGLHGIQNAKVIFLDEIFRGNSSILNTLLSIINERKYYESGESQPARAQVIFGASNQAPTSSDLEAFYARFPIRMLSERVNGEDRMKLLEKGWHIEMDILEKRADRSGEPFNDTAMATPGDLESCQRWLYHYWGQSNNWHDPNAALDAIRSSYFSIVEQINRYSELFRIDDRKFVKLFKLIMAHAMLVRGKDKIPGLSDIKAILKNTWEDPDLANSAYSALDHVIKQFAEQENSSHHSSGIPIPSRLIE